MRGNGSDLYQFSLTRANAFGTTNERNRGLPLTQQLTKLIRHRDQCVKRLEKLERLPHVGGNDQRVGARTVEVERLILQLRGMITQNNFDIVNIQSKMKTYSRNSEGFDVPILSQFNRQATVRERRYKADKGVILFSKDGKYDVSDHSGSGGKPKKKDHTLVTRY